MAKKKESLEKKLAKKSESMWLTLKKNEMRRAMKFAEDYKRFLKEVKTERESVEYFLKIAKRKGFRELGNYQKLKPGDRFYIVNRDKSLALGVVGKSPSLRLICASLHPYSRTDTDTSSG